MKTLLETKDVTKVYEVGTQKISALNGVSIKIQEGEFVSIIGKSGSGKSTLMHIIGLLDTPTTGEVILQDKNVVSYSEPKLAQVRNKEIGFVFQSFNLLKRTSAIENVKLPLMYSTVPRSEWDMRAKKMLDLVELGDRLNNKSNELSGGQKQRVAIARALVNEPSIILADEPTGNLDTKTENEIIKILRKLHSQGKTIVIVTHDDDIAAQADRQIVLRDGNVVSDS